MLGKQITLLILSIFAVAPVTAITRKGLSKRPTVVASPYAPGLAHYKSPVRTKVCYVTALGSGKDDSAAILAAAKSCNNGGTVVFTEPLYTVGKPLDLTFLNAIDFDIQGTIKFTTDTTYWQANTFPFAFQDGSAMWLWGGSDVNWYGGGTIDGSGQVWYDLFAKDNTIRRPHLFAQVGMKHATMSNLNMINPPNWFNWISDSSDIIFNNITLTAKTTSSNPVKNSDGWDTYRSDSITIQNSNIYNTDDCVSFKPNSTNIVVQNLLCSGSHGISVGSLGQYRGEKDIVENIYVYNSSLINASDSARIKVWQDAIPDANGVVPTNAGGGYGWVRNVTYDTMRDTNDDYAIELTTCYAQKNSTLCDLYPSQMVIQDILFKNFKGTSSKKYDPIVGTLVCSSKARCINIRAEDIDITTPSKKAAKWTCTNVDKSLLGIACS